MLEALVAYIVLDLICFGLLVGVGWDAVVERWEEDRVAWYAGMAVTLLVAGVVVPLCVGLVAFDVWATDRRRRKAALKRKDAGRC